MTERVGVYRSYCENELCNICSSYRHNLHTPSSIAFRQPVNQTTKTLKKV